MRDQSERSKSTSESRPLLHNTGLGDDASRSTLCLGITPLLHTIHMSLGFFVLFSAFTSINNILPAIVANKLGFYTLAVANSVFCISSLLIGPILCAIVNPKWVMVFGAVSITIFSGANLYPFWWSLIPSSILLGVGSSSMWIAQGVYITISASAFALQRANSAKSAMGRFTGIFFGIFQSNQVVGNLLSSLLLSNPHLLHRTTSSKSSTNKAEHGEKILFYCCVVLAGGSAIIFTLLPTAQKIAKRTSASLSPSSSSSTWNVQDDQKSSEDLREKETVSSVFANLTKCVKLLRDPLLLLLIPTFFYSGAQGAMMSALWTTHIVAASVGASKIGFLMAAFGGADVISSLILARIIDTRCGRRVVWSLGAIAELSFLLAFGFLLPYKGTEFIKQHQAILFAGAVVFGFGDAAANLVPGAVVSTYFSTSPALAYPHLKLWQSLGGVVYLLLGAEFSFPLTSLLAGSMLVFASVCLAILHVFFMSLDAHSHDEQQLEQS